jgi:hypothetical protein
MPLGLDEHVLPVISVGAVDKPPYRREGLRYTAGQVANALTLGEFAQCLFHFGITAPQLVFVVDKIILQPLDNTIATGVTVANAGAVCNFAPVQQNTIVSTTVYTTERYPGGLTLPEFSLNIGYRFTTSVTNPDIAAGQLFQAFGPNALVIETELPISGSMELQFGSVVAATAAIESKFAVTVSGLVYPTGGL